MRPRARRSRTNDNSCQDAPGSGLPAVVRRGPRLTAGVVVAFLLAGGAQVGWAGAAAASVGPVTVGSLTAAASGHHGDHSKADPSPSLHPSPSSTQSPSASADPGPSASSDPSPSHDPSPKPDPTPTSDPSATPSPTATPSQTPSQTPSPTPSPQPSPKPSPKPSPSSQPRPRLTPDPTPVPGSPSAGSPSVVPAPTAASTTAAPSPTAVARALGAGRVTATSDPLARFRSPSAQPSRPRHQSPDASLVVAKTRQPTAASARPSPGDARAASSSAAVSNDGPFRWTPLYVGWAAATVVALIALAVGPGALDRWRRR